MKVSYTEISKTYDDYRLYPKQLLETIIRSGEINERMRILDVGCGTGNVGSQLLELVNADVIGVDISVSMLKLARAKSLKIVCSDVDGNQLPFRDDSFDAAIGAYVIHQINNLRFLFSECYRILRGGVLVLLTSSHRQIEHQHPVIEPFFPSCVGIEKNRFPDIPKIDDLLKSVGFGGIKHQEVLVEEIVIDQGYLEKVRNKYVSTYHLLPQREFELGVKRLEAFVKSRSRPESREWKGTLIYGRKNE